VKNQGLSTIAGVDCGPPESSILMTHLATVMLGKIAVPIHFAVHGQRQAKHNQSRERDPDDALKLGLCKLFHANGSLSGKKCKPDNLK
jgi:hypothetical protein